MPWPAAAGRPEPSGFAAESIFTLLYSNQILLSRLCFLFLLIFVYKTQGSHQSPAQSARTPLWHTPISPPGSSQDSSFLGGFPASLAQEQGARWGRSVHLSRKGPGVSLCPQVTSLPLVAQGGGGVGTCTVAWG